MLNGIQGGLPQRSAGYTKSSGSSENVVSKKTSGFSYSSDSVKLSYNSSAGTQYQIEILHEEMKGFDLSAYTKNDKDIWGQQFGKSKSEFSGFYQSVKKIEITIVTTSEGVEGGKFSGLPEEWRPEAVAQRIFDFVTSFKGKTDAQGNDFFKLVKNAVLEGVKQALGELGDMDDETKQVINETTRLLNEKLESWGKEEGYITEPEGLDITA